MLQVLLDRLLYRQARVVDAFVAVGSHPVRDGVPHSAYIEGWLRPVAGTAASANVRSDFHCDCRGGIEPGRRW
ncbi:hypothetical protein AGR7A_pAt20291 [Agrobacterium deltaense NCPPB 1641]|uniref:Uncharacterized protein n=1 Tax=Agrobacterium deltaense NCPPB 1641 TaxID=1183425 RepID=A0A1S7U9P9_9HYPH|nr:hypothetical protein AGR7A_pAt20291 [Agrobacterium deltaense NCPPB 1641]